jgi:predicted RNase H-like HicB family nuclease
MSTPKEQKVALRCFAYPGKNGDQQGYYAVCIDLNLHTWRPTFKEARQSLNDAIHGYVEAALDLSKNEELTQKKIESLLHRLWHEGYTTAEIAKRVKKDEQTVRNKIADLRREFGEEIVPFRRK